MKKIIQVKTLFATEPNNVYDLKDAIDYIGKKVFIHPDDDPEEFEPATLLFIAKDNFVVDYDGGEVKAPFIFVHDKTEGGNFTEEARLSIKRLYDRANWIYMNFSGEPIVTDTRPLLVAHAKEWKHHDPQTFVENLKNSNLNRYVDNPKDSLINLNKPYGTLITIKPDYYDYDY